MHAPTAEVSRCADAPFLFIIPCRLPAGSNKLPIGSFSRVPNSFSMGQQILVSYWDHATATAHLNIMSLIVQNDLQSRS